MILGKQVALRPLESSDQPYVHELNSDPVVRGRVVGWDWPTSLSQQMEWFGKSAHATTTHRWIVTDLDGQQIGLSGLWDLDWHNRNAMTALKIGGRNPQRGRGVGSDAIKAVMAFAFYDVGLRRLHSTILADNAPSLRAYVNNCGWSVEGTARKHVWRHGRYVDLLHVGILKEEFDQLPDSTDYIGLAMGDPL